MGYTQQRNDRMRSDRLLCAPGEEGTRLLYLQEAGTLWARAGYSSRRQNLSSFLFLQISSGSILLRYRGQSLPLAAGDCALIDCAQGYGYRVSADCDLGWVHFAGSDAAVLYERYLATGGRSVFHPRTPGTLEHWCRQLFESGRLQGGAVRELHNHAALASLLAAAAAEAVPDALPPERMQRVRAYLRDRYRQPVSLQEVARTFAVDPCYLSRQFRQAYGTSVMAYLNDVRMQRAQFLLRFSSCDIAGVAQQCGFPDASYFARAFRRSVGCSPSEYRRNWRE